MAIYAKLHQLGAPEQQNLATCCVGRSDDYGADGKWRSNFEKHGWGIWLGDEIILFWGEQKAAVIGERAGRGAAGGSLEVGSDQ
jgi:hypothetical protein